MTGNSTLPHFLCIGAQKAATSWLWVMLRQNPKIWMPPVKELHFFDHLYIPENRAWTLNHILKGTAQTREWHVNNNVINPDYFRYLADMETKEPFTESWYRACYNRPDADGKVLGDITPEYSTLPEEGIHYIRELLGSKLRLIYIIRNPLERALSQLKMNLTRRSQENESEAFWLNAAKKSVILQRGDYKTYIPRWEKNFHHENILYLPYQMVKNDPKKFLREVETHIGVAPFSKYNRISVPVHRTKEAKVPDCCSAYLKDMLTDQDEFLLNHFGKKFVSLI
jgi:hypothetical protein